MAFRDPPHYLKTLRTTTTPKRLAWLDCQAARGREGGATVERWCAGAMGTTHYTSRKHDRRDTIKPYDDAELLWFDLSAYCVDGKRVVLFAHDLAYQLRISRALVHLPALGWHVERIVLEKAAAWALFRHGKRSLLCCDLASWAPCGLDTIARDLSSTGERQAGAQAGADWPKQIAGNRVRTIRDAVLQIFAWIEGENLGPFRPTGSGQSYSAYRRRFLKDRLLVHDDEHRLALERQAMHTGRCEAWRHGQLSQGPYIEHDMHAAYATIGAECDVPTIAVGRMHKPSVERIMREVDKYALLAQVTITTDVPVAPVRINDRTLWPVGTFETVIWDPEITLALEYATEVTFHGVYKYRKAPAIADFCRYVLDGLGDQLDVYGPVPRRVIKHWTRCMIGRLGLRYRSWAKFGTCEDQDLRLVTFIDLDDKTATDMLCAGHDRLILTDLQESTESLPQVPSWVMSECRRRLWEAMMRVGLENVVYVDTDSMIVPASSTGMGRPDTLSAVPGQWNRRGTYDRLVVRGPRNLDVESTRRVSGLPLTARQVAPLEFTGEVMRSIKESMRTGELDCVASVPRTFKFHTGDLRRQHLPYGVTVPYRIEVSSNE